MIGIPSDYGPFGKDQNAANARLIAAAPDLYAVLSRIIRRATAPMSNGDIDMEDVYAARRALAKADGMDGAE